MADSANLQVRPASQEEAGLFFAMKPEEDVALGCIGHVRMDFGRGGREFWHTWHPRGSEELNSQVFKDELTTVVDALRESVLKDLNGMREYCRSHGGAIPGGWSQNYGFVVETDSYRYCLRCNPVPGDYQAYLTCFDKQVQEMNRSGQTQTVQRGTAMTELTKKEFVKQLKELCPVTDAAAQMWCRWSAELEETDRAGEDNPEWEYKTEAQFRGELMRMFTEIKNRFGEEVAGQVVSLGDVPHCLYPWEIVPAAEHLHKGGDLKELPDMSIEGSLDGVEEYLEMKL